MEHSIDIGDAFNQESWLEPVDMAIKSLWEWRNPEETPLQIAICGAGGTGKRKLAKALGVKLGILVVDSTGRTLSHNGYHINKNTTIESECAAFFAALWALLDNDEELISAGSLIDILAYVKFLADRTADKKIKGIAVAMANCVQSIVYETYTVFFYLPLREKPKADGIRSVDMRFQQEIDKNIVYFLQAFDLDYFPLVGSSRQKLTTAMDYLGDFQLLVDRDD